MMELYSVVLEGAEPTYGHTVEKGKKKKIHQSDIILKKIPIELA